MSKIRTKWDTPAYRAERKRLGPIIKRNGAECQQPTCIKESRWIAPGEPWHLGHDVLNGTVIDGSVLGPTHPTCNQTDGGKKRHQQPGVKRSYSWL